MNVGMNERNESMKYHNILNFSSYTQIFEQEAAGTGATGGGASGISDDLLAIVNSNN